MSSPAIESVLGGRDTLVVVSTDSAKSAIHEIAGVSKPGVTVVISKSEPPPDGDGSICVRPEELESAEVLDRLRAAAPAFVVVDDAQCVSSLADDFDPDYLRLGAFIAEMGHPPVFAMTPGASADVREEIVERLHLHEPLVVAPEA